MSDMDRELNLYLDERLSPEEAQAVEDRLARDPEYRRRLEEIARVPEAFAQVFAPTAEPDFDALWSGIEARLDEEAAPATEAEPAGERSAWWHWFFQPLVGLSVVTAIALFTVLVSYRSPADGFGGVMNGPAAVATSADASSSMDPGRTARVAPTPRQGERRALVQEQRAPRVLAIVESYDVSRGVVVVNAPSGSSRQPLVIWHIVPGEAGAPTGVDERSKL